MKEEVFSILYTEEELQQLILTKMATQEAVDWAIILGIVLACVVAVAITLWYFLHPKSPRQARLKRKEDAEEAQRRKEEQLQKKIGQKLKELNFTCQHCKAPGLKGPKCEYCQHINFSLDELR